MSISVATTKPKTLLAAIKKAIDEKKVPPGSTIQMVISPFARTVEQEGVVEASGRGRSFDLTPTLKSVKVARQKRGAA